MDVQAQIDAWTLKAAELEAEAKELRVAGLDADAAEARLQATRVEEHIRRLKELL